MTELQRTLDQRNLELTLEERRLSELDSKYQTLMKNKDPASVMKMHDDDLKRRTNRGGEEDSNN